jgi:hypothetical protein
MAPLLLWNGIGRGVNGLTRRFLVSKGQRALGGQRQGPFARGSFAQTAIKAASCTKMVNERFRRAAVLAKARVIAGTSAIRSYPHSCQNPSDDQLHGDDTDDHSRDCRKE